MADDKVPFLKIRLLGVPDVLFENEPLTIHRRQVRMLLYFLACQRDPIRRARLSDTFWSDKPDQAGREALRDALRRLRQALPLPGVLNSAADLVMLHHPHMFVDVREFENSYQALARKVGYFSQAEPLPHPIHQQIAKAVSLWRSNELLDGIETENQEIHLWLTGERNRLASQRALLIIRLADHEMACGDLQAALRWLTIAAQIHDDDPDLHLRWMRCLEGLGRWGELMFYLDKVEALYSDDVAGRMPPALVEFCQGVRRRATPRPSDRIVPRLEGLLNAPDMRFVGRQDMLSELNRAYMRGGSMVLWGEAGGGKTRLVYQVYQQLEPLPRLLVAPCTSAASNQPFEPLIDLLRQSLVPEDWQLLQPVWVTQLSRLLPEVVALRPDVGNAFNLSLGEARPLLFQAFHELMLKVSQNQRLLFFVDDAQWADEATLSLLAFLINQDFFPRHGLLLLAARGEEKSPTLEQFLSRSPRQWHIQEMTLPPMNEEEIAELVLAVVGVPSPAHVSRRLVEVTGGNPLLLLETLRNMMLASSPLSEDILTSLPITSGTHALVRDRLRTLPDDTIQTLYAAAVIGQQFSQDLLEQAVELERGAITEALELLVDKHLIQTISGKSGGQYRFIHEIFREVILAELSQPRRYLIHTRIAEALRPQVERDPSQAAAVAQHYEAAGKPVEAFACWLQAGKHALRLIAPNVMHQDCQRAEALLLKHSYLFDERAIYDLYAPWMHVSAEQGNLEEANRLADMLQTMGQQRANALLLGTSLSGRAFQFLLRSDYEHALDSIQQAILYLKRADDPIELVNAYSRLATIYEMECHFKEARVSLQRALALSRSRAQGDMHEAVIVGMARLAYVENCMGFPLVALVLGEEALALSRQNFFPVGEMRALAQMSYACFLTMRLEQCLEYCRQGLVIAERYQYMRRMGYLRIISARAELAQGRLDASWQDATIALSIGESYGYPEMAMEARGLLGDHFIALRDYSSAIAVFQHGLDPDCDSLNAYNLHFRLGLTMVQGGDQRGQAYIDEAYEMSLASELASVYLPIMTSQAMMAAADGDSQRARRLLSQLERASEERHFGGLASTNLLIRCQIALSSGDYEAAATLAQAAIEANRDDTIGFLDVKCYEALRDTRRAQDLPADDIERRLAALVHHITSQITQSELQVSLPVFRSSVLVKRR
ncbi:MAG: AAA family ATPase [Anaerolineae bacterium]|nr:AAA family ATPase [Anaerolineae bacterium]